MRRASAGTLCRRLELPGFAGVVARRKRLPGSRSWGVSYKEAKSQGHTTHKQGNGQLSVHVLSYVTPYVSVKSLLSMRSFRRPGVRRPPDSRRRLTPNPHNSPPPPKISPKGAALERMFPERVRLGARHLIPCDTRVSSAGGPRRNAPPCARQQSILYLYVYVTWSCFRNCQQQGSICVDILMRI